MLHAFNKGGDAQITAVVDSITRTKPDVIALQGLDYDLSGATLAALGAALAQAGHDLPYVFAARPNSGWRTGLDHDGDGYADGPRDAQGFGWYSGQGGMAVLSRYPLGDVQDFSDYLWKDLPGALLPHVDGAPFPSKQVQEVQRLSSVGHWLVPVLVGDTVVNVLTFHAGPPVFDGPEDRNGKRNHDEIRFWQLLLDGALPFQAPTAPFVIAGDANLDPDRSDGLRAAIRDMLADPRLQDPRPSSAQAGLNTVDWPNGPGQLRVDYVLPSVDLRILDAGVDWPAQPEAGSRHRLVWVDIALP